MADEIPKIIAAINPRYMDTSDKQKTRKVRELLKKGRFQDAVKEIKPEAVWKNHMTYDSPSTTLEPLYFWLLDKIKDFGYDIEKVVDNFSASPGSGYFAELGARATKMQEEGIKILGTVNTVIKSIVNIIYDLKDFEIRLKHYDNVKSK